MEQLGREVNACVSGIRSVHPDAAVDVWDGHGSGGLRESDVADARYLDDGKPYFDIEEYTALLFVGQHAMAGTVDAPLAHTYSSTDIAYYRLNDTFVGEFGARAFVAGRQGVPTVYLAGDDKAAREAEMFVPDITTTAVKVGQGREAARHLPQDEACERSARTRRGRSAVPSASTRSTASTRRTNSRSGFSIRSPTRRAGGGSTRTSNGPASTPGPSD